MRHYKIVKRGTIISIALASLAVFLQLGLAIYTKNSFVPIKQVRAEDAPTEVCQTGDPADILAYYEGNVLRVSLLTRYPTSTYGYKITLTNDSTGSIIGTEDTGETRIAPGSFPALINFTIPWTSQDSSLTLKVDFKYNADITGVQNCIYSTTKPIASYNNFASNAVSLTLRTDKSSIDLIDANGQPIESPAKINITYSFVYDLSKQTNYEYSLTITSCDGKAWEKAGGVLSTEENTINWAPEERCGSRSATIMLKVFDATTQMVVGSDIKYVTINDGASTGVTPDPNAGKAKIGDVKLSTEEFEIFGSNGLKVKLATIEYGLGPVVDLTVNIIEYILGILAFAGLVYGGIMYITAGGDDAKAEKAKKSILYSVVGIIVAALATTIVLLIKSLIS